MKYVRVCTLIDVIDSSRWIVDNARKQLTLKSNGTSLNQQLLHVIVIKKATWMN